MMKAHDPRPASHDRLEVWIDGRCGLCTASRRWLERRDRGGRFVFRDFTACSDELLPAPRASLEAAVHVRDRAGLVTAGFEAWRRLMAELPGWRALAAVAGWPGVRSLGRLAYVVVARSRHRWARPPACGLMSDQSVQPGAGTPNSRNDG